MTTYPGKDLFSEDERIEAIAEKLARATESRRGDIRVGDWLNEHQELLADLPQHIWTILWSWAVVDGDEADLRTILRQIGYGHAPAWWAGLMTPPTRNNRMGLLTIHLEHSSISWSHLGAWLAGVRDDVLNSLAQEYGGQLLSEYRGAHQDNVMADVIRRSGTDSWPYIHHGHAHDGLITIKSMHAPWVLGWGMRFKRQSSNIDPENLLDIMLDQGCNIDAGAGPRNTGALEHLLFDYRSQEDTMHILVPGGMAKMMNAGRLAILLLDRGAAWEHLEPLVSADGWDLIQRHPQAVRARLADLGKIQGHTDNGTQRAL